MKAVFIDRDGTINDDQVGYISKVEDFVIFPYAAEAISLLKKLGFLVIVVTNQSGIARGYITENELDILHKHMLIKLNEHMVNIDLILYSPYLAEGQIEPFNIDHITRKPKPGMFYEALKKYPILAHKSYMIGDSAADVEFGKNLGLTTIMVKTGNGNNTWNFRDEMNVLPDFVVENLLSAAKLIEVFD